MEYLRLACLTGIPEFTLLGDELVQSLFAISD